MARERNYLTGAAQIPFEALAQNDGDSRATVFDERLRGLENVNGLWFADQ
jgi:hypothetical protein